MSRKPTAKDVASLAGVSRSAVSMVVNGRDEGMVAPVKRQRILDAAEELGYTPSSVGRSLRAQRTRTIGLVTDRIASAAYGGDLIRGATDAALAAGYLLVTVDTHGEHAREKAAYEALLQRDVDALMFASVSLREYDVTAAMADHPAVLANCFDPTGSVPGFIADEVAGGRAAGKLLLEAGHREVVVLGGSHNLLAAPRREQGIAEAFAAAGLAPPQVVAGGWDIATGHAAATEVLSRSDRPTALICSNDRVAAGAVLAAARLGVDVPGAVSVMGYDDDENVAPTMVPALSTVAIAHADIGEVAMTALITHLEHGEPLPTEDTLLPCEVVDRASVAPPPA